MARETETKVNHFDDGFLSYPRMRIRYPETEPEEQEWLAGWYHAKRLEEVELQDLGLGLNTWFWEYKTGE